MAYAGHISDLPPEERYSLSRLKGIVDQTVNNMPHIQEVLTGLLYQIEQLESRTGLSYVDPDTEPYANEVPSEVIDLIRELRLEGKTIAEIQEKLKEQVGYEIYGLEALLDALKEGKEE